MAGQQRGKKPQSQRGDFTGNKKADLQKEHEEQVSERREELGMISATKDAVKNEGVIDMMGAVPTLDTDHPDLNTSLRAAMAEQAARLQAAGAQPAPGEDGPISDAVGRTLIDPETTMPVQPTETPVGGTRLGGSETTIDVFELEPERPQAAAHASSEVDPDKLNQPVIIRSLYDLEDVTIGYGNNFTFRADYRYKVPLWVAAHLEEKQLCIVLSLVAA